MLLVEQAEDDSTSLDSKKIARLSFKISNRVRFAKDEEKIDLLAALQLLTQSMLLLSNNEVESRRLYHAARRLS